MCERGKQEVYKYVKKTGDSAFLDELIGGLTVARRLEWSMEFLLNHRWSEEYGLISDAPEYPVSMVSGGWQFSVAIVR